MIQQRNEDQDDPSWGTVEDLKVQAAESDIGDNTHFMACKSYCILMEAGEDKVMLFTSVK